VIVALNPSVGLAFAGADRRPTFEPGVMAKVKVGRIAAGFEYYGSTGALWDPAALREQEHYLFGAVDLLAVKNLELNVAAGAGLTGSSNDLIVKAIIGWTFE